MNQNPNQLYWRFTLQQLNPERCFSKSAAINLLYYRVEYERMASGLFDRSYNVISINESQRK